MLFALGITDVQLLSMELGSACLIQRSIRRYGLNPKARSLGVVSLQHAYVLALICI